MTPLPPGPFNLISADPPWHFSTRSVKGRDRCPDGRPMTRAESRTNDPARHYETMALDDIKALPVASVAAKDCVLMLWAVDPMLPQAFEVGAAWGFTYKTVGFYWAKTRRPTSTRGEANDFPMGTGYWTRANPEVCLLFTRGAPKRVSASVQKLIVAPRREHSRKPDEQYERMEALIGDVPRLEMFARRRWSSGWTVWGDQAPVETVSDKLVRLVKAFG